MLEESGAVQRSHSKLTCEAERGDVFSGVMAAGLNLLNVSLFGRCFASSAWQSRQGLF